MTNHARGFAALADPTRRLIFERLARRPMSVGKLAAGAGGERAARSSQHLKIPQGTPTWWPVTRRARATSIASNPRRAWRRCARTSSGFWDRALQAFKAAAEEKDS